MICERCGGNRTEDWCNLCDLFAAHAPPAGPSLTGWPMNAGMSLGVNPRQRQKAQNRADRHGIQVTYTKSGDVIVPDRVNYAKLLKLEGLRNKAEGFHGA